MDLFDYPLPVRVFAALGLYVSIYLALLAVFFTGDRIVTALLRRRKARRTNETA